MLKLEPLQTSDSDKIYEIIQQNRKFLGRWVEWARAITKQQNRIATAERVDEMARGKILIYKVMKNNEIIGVVDAHPMDTQEAEIGYWISEAESGNGQGTQAVQMLIKEVLSRGVKNIKAVTNESNIASCKLLKKLGFSEAERIDGELVFRLGNQQL